MITWTKVSDALPTEYGTYLVIRGHCYMGVMTYEIATTDFHPTSNRWFDRGFVYTHWFGPVTKPEMDLKEFPILCEDPEKEVPCSECGQIRAHQNHWAPFGWHNFEAAR